LKLEYSSDEYATSGERGDNSGESEGEDRQEVRYSEVEDDDDGGLVQLNGMVLQDAVYYQHVTWEKKPGSAKRCFFSKKLSAS